MIYDRCANYGCSQLQKEQLTFLDGLNISEDTRCKAANVHHFLCQEEGLAMQRAREAAA